MILQRNPDAPAGLIRPFELAAGWVLACLLLGGASNAGALANLALQCGASLIIAAALWRGRRWPLTGDERWLRLGLIALLGWIAITLIPLPPMLWSHLPGRGFVAQGYGLLGMDLPWLPISLADERTVRSALALLIPVATYLTVRPLGQRERLLLAALVAGFALASVALGMAQLASGTGSPLRFYAITNRSSPVGLFANTNHFATMLLVALPLLLAAEPGLRRRPKRGAAVREWQPAVLCGVALLALGLVLTGSNAGRLLLVPSLAGALLLGPLRNLATRPVILRLLAVLGALAIAAVALSVTTGLFAQKIGVSATSRDQVTRTTLGAAREFLPTGSGLGSFPAIYLKVSGGEKSASEWMNHAHDDPAEVALELGLPGIVLMGGFALWLLTVTWRRWAGAAGNPPDPLARAATLGLVLIATHSLADYPLRTAAMAALFGLLLALVASTPPEDAAG